MDPETERLRRLVEAPTLLDANDPRATRAAEKLVTQKARKSVSCAKHNPHGTNVMVWTCRHAVWGTQDVDKPDGLVALPGSVFVCKTCDRLIDQNKFDIGTDMVVQCYGCVMEFSKWLFARNPDLLIDKTKKPR